MPTGRRDSFLEAEEEAHRLVEALKQLKAEAESYKTARKALAEAASGVSELSTRCASIAEQLGGVAETLRSSDMAELLGSVEAVATELRTLRDQLEQQHEADRQQVQSVRESLDAQVRGVVNLVTTLRNLAFGSIAISLIALVFLGWLVLSLGRG